MFNKLRAKYFPFDLPGGIVVRSVDDETYQAVREALFDELFPRWNHMGRYTLPDERKPKVARLQKIHNRGHRERFVFYDGDVAVGWSVGRMENPITYRMNNSGLIPAYRNKGIYSAFLQHLLAYIKAIGYERVVSYHHLTNRVMLATKIKAGFNVTGNVLGEDAGACVQLTYFFYEDRLHAFEDAFGLERDWTR